MPSEQTFQNNNIEDFIKELYIELMDTRRKLINFRKEKKTNKIEETELLLDGLQKDYDGLVKTHSAYIRMTKLNGKSNTENLAEMARLLNEIKSNVGGIVQSIPKK